MVWEKSEGIREVGGRGGGEEVEGECTNDSKKAIRGASRVYVTELLGGRKGERKQPREMGRPPMESPPPSSPSPPSLPPPPRGPGTDS